MSPTAHTLPMTKSLERCPPDTELVETILRRAAADLSAVLGQPLEFETKRIERAHARPAGPDQIHISFKFGIRVGTGVVKHGALLVPLPDSITLACQLLVLPADTVSARRHETVLDDSMKDALLEIGNIIGSSTSAALLALGLEGWAARSEGCQGVRANASPTLPHASDVELVVARSVTKLGSFPPFGTILVIPVLS